MHQRISRRKFLAAGAASAALLASPGVLRAQTREIFVGGPASPGLQEILFPLIEKKHGFKILYEGSNSLINLQKIQANKDRPTMTATMMDDPVLILAEREKLIQKLPAEITNLPDILPEAKPREAMWVNWCQPMCSASFNTKAVPGGIASYADAWDKKYRDRIVMISMRVTQAIAPLVAAASLATGKPLVAAMKEWQAGFEKLKEIKPNILQVSIQGPQLQQLLESGEAELYLSPDSRTTLFRKANGAPVEQAYPKEGVFAMPAGVALVRNGPNPELGMKFIDEMLNPETQALIAKTFYSKPTNTKTVLADGLTFPELAVLDWEYFTDNRGVWIDRFEREIAAR